MSTVYDAAACWQVDVNRTVVTDDELKRVFDFIDKDRSGDIDLQEFMARQRKCLQEKEKEKTISSPLLPFLTPLPTSFSLLLSFFQNKQNERHNKSNKQKLRAPRRHRAAHFVKFASLPGDRWTRASSKGR